MALSSAALAGVGGCVGWPRGPELKEWFTSRVIHRPHFLSLHGLCKGEGVSLHASPGGCFVVRVGFSPTGGRYCRIASMPLQSLTDTRPRCRARRTTKHPPQRTLGAAIHRWGVACHHSFSHLPRSLADRPDGSHLRYRRPVFSPVQPMQANEMCCVRPAGHSPARRRCHWSSAYSSPTIPSNGRLTGLIRQGLTQHTPPYRAGSGQRALCGASMIGMPCRTSR